MVPGTVLRNAWALYRANWRHLVSIALVVNVLVTAIVIALGYLDWVVAVFVSFVGSFWLQGVLVRAADDVRDGHGALSLRQTLEGAFPRINVLSASGMLAAVGIGVGIFLVIVPGLVLLTIWSMIVPAIMLENAGVFRSFSRSRELVRGNGWNVFVIVIVTFVLLLAAGLLLSVILLPTTNWVLVHALEIIVTSILAPFVAAALTLTYYELRAASLPRTA